MNGRIYDPELGRMLSPDPYVQVPEYSQNFNRYSYVLNNPLNATDPSGFSWLSKAFHKIGHWIKENWRTIVVAIVAIVLTICTYGAASGWGAGMYASAAGVSATSTAAATAGAAFAGGYIGAVVGGLGAALNGGNLGDILRGALVGGIQGALTGGWLKGMEPGSTGFSMDMVEHVAGHGVVGGAANVAMGGKFGDGFLSAAVSAFAADMGTFQSLKMGSPGDLSNPLKVAGRTAVAGIIGGTASALGGGKFSNGAATATFQHLLNAEGPSIIETWAARVGPLRGYYNRENGHLGLYNTETDEAIIRDGFRSGSGAGLNRSDMEDVPNIGPTPKGFYRILPRPGNGAKGIGMWEGNDYIYKDTGHPGFKLFKIDANPYDDQTYVNGVKRDNFRIHQRYPTTGIGCITHPNVGEHAGKYNAISKFILGSSLKNNSHGIIEVY